jgi:uncharacterized protein (TIGR02996 family)
MTDNDFFQAILEDPDDDLCRLVYADWQDDRGHPERAELIRVQCRLARLTTNDPAWTDLRARERLLIDVHGEEWFGPLMEFAPTPNFHRGMPCLALTAARFCESRFQRVGPKMMQLLGAQELRITTTLREIGRLVDSPVLGILHTLMLWNSNTTATDMARFADVPHICHLVDLVVENHSLGNRGLESLSRSPHLSRLRRLSLDKHSGRLPMRGVKALLHSPNGPRLERLSLRGCLRERYSHDLSQFLCAPYLGRLRSLDLSDNLFGDGAAAAISNARLGALSELHLAKNQIGDWGARELIASPFLQQLNRLNLYGNTLTLETKECLRDRFGNGVTF